MANTLIPIRALGRDLFADVECTCKKELVPGVMVNNKIKLTGYNDSYFFDEVNKEPRECACKCGRILHYRWTPDGVSVRWGDGSVEPRGETNV